MAKWVGQCAVMALMWPGSSTCRSAATLIPGAHPTGATVQTLHHVDNGGLVKPNLTFLGPPLHCATACAGRRPLARDSSSVSRSSHLSQARLHHAGTVQVHPSRDATFAATFDLFRPTNRDHLNLDREFHLIYISFI